VGNCQRSVHSGIRPDRLSKNKISIKEDRHNNKQPSRVSSETRPRSGELSLTLGNKAFAERPTLERDSSATQTSLAVKPANIRMINRRRMGPVSVYALEQ